MRIPLMSVLSMYEWGPLEDSSWEKQTLEIQRQSRFIFGIFKCFLQFDWPSGLCVHVRPVRVYLTKSASNFISYSLNYKMWSKARYRGWESRTSFQEGIFFTPHCSERKKEVAGMWEEHGYPFRSAPAAGAAEAASPGKRDGAWENCLVSWSKNKSSRMKTNSRELVSHNPDPRAKGIWTRWGFDSLQSEKNPSYPVGLQRRILDLGQFIIWIFVMYFSLLIELTSCHWKV